MVRRQPVGRLSLCEHSRMDLPNLELAVRRLRDAEAAMDAARADVEIEAVLAVRRGEAVEDVSAVSGITPEELLRLERTAERGPV